MKVYSYIFVSQNSSFSAQVSLPNLLIFVIFYKKKQICLRCLVRWRHERRRPHLCYLRWPELWRAAAAVLLAYTKKGRIQSKVWQQQQLCLSRRQRCSMKEESNSSEFRSPFKSERNLGLNERKYSVFVSAPAVFWTRWINLVWNGSVIYSGRSSVWTNLECLRNCFISPQFHECSWENLMQNISKFWWFSSVVSATFANDLVFAGPYWKKAHMWEKHFFRWALFKF